MTAGMPGCTNKEQKALDLAKKQALSTGQPQQVSSVDQYGNTTTTVVQPPAPGQKEPTLVTTTAPPPAGAPKPSPKGPTVSALQNGSQADGSQAQNPSGSDQSGSAASAQQAAGQQPASNGQGAPAAPAAVSVPAGTTLAIRVDQSISVKHSHAGDRFTGEVTEPIAASDGNVLVPKLTRVRGRIDEAHRRGHFKGASLLELRLTSIELQGKEYPIETADLAERKKGKGKRSTAMIGGGAGLGMLIGGLASGGTGLLIGGLAGGGAGTAAAGLTGNRDLVIPAESVVRFKLAQDLVVREAR
jgi:hypothetical protein